ncbi:TonB-dependent receptor [Cognatilysobacter tabacisoli]|uniref:TonB-dependent receptor n=1 Tax=Cognatilysobacter tabacisoli TaxID=2315424 RepID=UPI000E6B23BE|nr:TonB-dependent receptor [Lysobacter tabacisoli]
MLRLKRNLLSMALASATVLIATGAQAQTADPQTQAPATEGEATELDKVVVTGIRAGIENAIETKQENSSIVEAISAEDIGKLPDTSIADSIARLPGLTAQRFGGRPQEINIRGFSGDFSTTTLNGREQVSLGNNRGVEFDQYPSELINQVVVYKTQDASLVGQGLSGTVDLQTVSPLSYGEQVIAVNVRGDLNKRGDNKEYGNRFSLSYVDQFADNTVGLALGYARLNNPVQGTQFESWGYDNGVLGGGKLYQIDNDNERDGFVGVLEFKPNDVYSSRLDLFYSKFDKLETKRGMEFGLVFGPPGQPVSRTNNAEGTAIQATFNNFDPVIRNDYNAAKDDLFSIGWNNKLRLNEAWTLSADISSSSAKREERILETYAGLANGVAGDTVGITFNPDGYFDFDFGYDYTDPSILRLTDAGGWGQDGYIKDFEVKDELTSVRFDLERTFESGVLSSLDFGVNLTDRTKSRASNENFLCLNACRDGAQAPLPAGNGSDFDFAGLTGLYGYDALNAFNTIYNRRANINNGDINNKNWEVNERVATFYVQANLDFDLGSIPVRGNIGVQGINVDQTSTGVSTFEGITLDQPATRGATYTDYLPSLNLKAQLPAEQYIRFGAGRQQARPRMDQMRANAGYSINRTPTTCPAGDAPPCPQWSGSGGNSELRPWEADALDLSYEKYFAGKGYVSAGYFYKDLKTYVYDQVTQFDFSQLPLPPNLPASAIPQSSIGEFSQPINGEGGTLKGWEFAVSIPLEMLWAPLEGFGIQANYSEVDSEIRPDGPDRPATTLPGLSKYVSNATAYYERFGFSARVSQRTRSDFRGEVQGFGGDRTVRIFEGEKVTDVQLGYTIQSGPLENLSFLLQVNNVENEPFRSTFDGRQDRPREFFEYGRTYLFGVNYRF